MSSSTADPDILTLAEAISDAGSVVALTGAGISVPSGIPDFRTPGKGLWSKVDPMKVATIDAFHRDTKHFWEFYRPRFQMLSDKLPNAAHHALARLESAGKLDAVITQNIDRLHRSAGTTELVEVHGSVASSSCLTCGRSYELDRVEELFCAEGIAICVDCGGKVKPDVVLFGEMLPVAEIDRARFLAEDADLMLCIGSALEVFPAAGLPEVTLEAGGQVAVMTQSTTPYDAAAVVRLNGDLAVQLPEVVEVVCGG
ncbi:MAG: SIR2 family NAD-dependent protein deacylase [Solirubrobacterales bacterium]